MDEIADEFKNFPAQIINLRLIHPINYTPDIRSMWGYIVFAFPLVRSFVRLFVRSSFRHRVKVFALKFIRPHILKTL